MRRTHSGEKGPKVPCKICGKEFSKTAIKKHVEAVHKGVRYKCPHCEKDYSAQSDMAAHVRAVHEGIKEACHFCTMVFQRSSDRNRHERQSHAAKMEKVSTERIIIQTV